LAAADRGHRRNKSSITDDIAKEAFDDLDNTREVCYGIYDELDAALEQGKLDVAKVLSKQLRTLADTMKSRYKMLRERLSPAVPTPPQ
jgi:soluble cytochrome b562